jgi:pimeloyl-ACP methyl ester carboxylesterase
MVPFERYAVDVGGDHPGAPVRMHVMEIGSGRPVLLLHGNPTWGFLYRRVVSAVIAAKPNAGLRFVMPDLIGLGYSDKPRDAAVHTIDNHARWLRALIDALDLRDLIFVGQDWGGPIGLAALRPVARESEGRGHRMKGLVLLNTVVGPPRKGFKPTAFHRLARTPVLSDIAFKLLGVPQTMLFAAQGDRRSIRGDVARAYRTPIETWDERTAPLALARMVPNTHEHPSIAPLSEIERFVTSFEGPKSIVWGDRDPVLGRVRPWMEKLLPDAEVTRTDAGHFLQEEVPNEIAAAILSVASRIGKLK